MEVNVTNERQRTITYSWICFLYRMNCGLFVQFGSLAIVVSYASENASNGQTINSNR